MSFGGENVSKITLKNFESQEEIDEKKRRRQEEWDRVRKPDDPLECPEQEKRSLFEQLQAIKEAKEHEIEEEHRLRSSVKGLDEEEAGFLNFVSKRQMEIEKERRNEEDSVLKEMREAAVTMTTTAATTKSSVKEKSPTRPSCSGVSRKSQQALLCGAVKRKRSSSPEKKLNSSKHKKNSPERKQSSPERKENSLKHKPTSPDRKHSSPDRKHHSPDRKQYSPERKPHSPKGKHTSPDRKERREHLSKAEQSSPNRPQDSPHSHHLSPDRKPGSPSSKHEDHSIEDDEGASASTQSTPWAYCKASGRSDVARVLGVLPGIGEYSGDSSDTTSSSESDLDDLFPQKTVIRKVHVVEGNH